MEERDYELELRELKKEIKDIVGKETIKNINKVIETSNKYEEKVDYKVTYKIIK
jgi:hypothetical protein